MARILILSSFVAASRVGGGAQALALTRLGIEPILAPTVLFGRHPGHGPPGGGPVAPETFEAVLGGAEAHGVFSALDAVITGYFSSVEQVAVAAAVLARVKAASPAAHRIVDPIMGDEARGLYVREPVAEAIATDLIAAADVVAPNAWELERLTGHAVGGPESALVAARALDRPVLVSSVVEDTAIGAVYADAHGAWFADHPFEDSAPKGVGDLLTAIFAAALVEGRAPAEALELGVGVVADAVAASHGLDELPLASLPMQLKPSSRVSVRRLDG